MFEFSKKNNPLADTELSYLTTIGAGSLVRGNFTHSGNMLLLGHLIGEIAPAEDDKLASAYTAVIGKTGFLEGNIYSSHAIIVGRIEGSVLAKGRVEIYPGAEVFGDVTYSQINIHPDAKVNGNLKCLLPDGTPQANLPLAYEGIPNNVVPLAKAE
jgi:cytoskeletal protein CcmA (bactofilin family)